MTILKNININSDINATNDVWPAGTIIKSASAAIPDGWLPCAGQAVSRTTYANLFAVISTDYGGSGSTFNLPDLRGRVESFSNTMNATVTGIDRVVMGRGGTRGGEKITLFDVPSHGHSVGSMNSASSHNHYMRLYYQSVSSGPSSVNVPGGSSVFGGFGTTSTSINHTHNVYLEGGGNSHNNMMPYLVVLAIIKT